MYYIEIYVIDNCGFSENALKSLKKINHEVIKVDYNKKYIYKNNDINTFPQIFLKKNNSKGSLLLGGNDDLQYIVNTIENNNDPYKNLKNKYNSWSKKAILRLIELFIK